MGSDGAFVSVGVSLAVPPVSSPLDEQATASEAIPTRATIAAPLDLRHQPISASVLTTSGRGGADVDEVAGGIPDAGHPLTPGAILGLRHGRSAARSEHVEGHVPVLHIGPVGEAIDLVLRPTDLVIDAWRMVVPQKVIRAYDEEHDV